MTGLKRDRWIVRVSLVYHPRVFTIISEIVLFTARCCVLRHQETKQLLYQYRGVTSASINTGDGYRMALAPLLPILFALYGSPTVFSNFCVSRGNFYRLNQIFYFFLYTVVTVVPVVKQRTTLPRRTSSNASPVP